MNGLKMSIKVSVSLETLATSFAWNIPALPVPHLGRFFLVYNTLVEVHVAREIEEAITKLALELAVRSFVRVFWFYGRVF